MRELYNFKNDLLNLYVFPLKSELVTIGIAIIHGIWKIQTG